MEKSRVVEEIKSRIDILDFISGYVQLRKAGQNWKGLCPFHAEKTPSFTVNPAKQIFHCFGCSTGGDVISFLMKHDNLSFGEAVKTLAERTGVRLEHTGRAGKTAQKEERLRNVLSVAAAYFEQQCGAPKPASYLRDRGITAESARNFRLGYAPPGWHNLLTHLRAAGVSDELARDAGLAVAGDRGLYDMFRHRLIFPIASASGAIVAFGGRAMDDHPPKYLNSPETPVFRKSATLYGLAQAKQEIRRRGSVMIVEGYLDVIVSHQFGFSNAVAPLGTALTAEHAARLRTMTDRALIVFDGDRAGIAAAQRSLPLLLGEGLGARVLILPDGEDPDSYLRSRGAAAFEDLRASAKSVISFLFSLSPASPAAVVRRALDLLIHVKDPIAAEDMLIELAGKTRISEETIRSEFRALRQRVTGGRTNAYNTAARAAAHKEEHILLGAVIAFPDRLGGLIARIRPDALSDPVASSLLARFAEVPGGDLAAAVEGASPEERALFTRLSVEPGFDPEHVDRNIEDCVAALGRRDLDRRIREAERSGDLALLTALLKEKHAIMKGKGT